VFAEAGFGGLADDPAAVAARVAQSPIHRALVAALDDWWFCSDDDRRVCWIMDVVRSADRDPTGWRDRVRQPGLSRESLDELAATAAVQNQSVQLLLALDGRMRTAGADWVPFLDRVQRQYPGDFWANYLLGEGLFEKNASEAIRYYQAALTGHPESALGQRAVGLALSKANRIEESILPFRQALQLEPTFAQVKCDLGWALVTQGHVAEGLKLAREAVEQDGSAPTRCRLAVTLAVLNLRDEAIGEFRRAFEIDPRNFWGHINLASCFELWERFDDAMAELECCRRLEPDSGWVHLRMGTVLKKQDKIDDAMAELDVATRQDVEFVRAGAHTALGDCWRAKGSPQLALMEYDQARLLSPGDPFTLRGRREVMVQLGLGVAARAEWERALEANPTDHGRWDGYAELCLYLKDQDAYEKACHRLLDLFGTTDDAQVCERTGRSCMLGVIPAADASRATAMIERVVQAHLPSRMDWTRPYFLLAQGLARYRHDDFDGTDESIGVDSQKVLGPLPHLVLAMAHQRAGRRAEALRSFARAVRIFDWDPSHASGPDEWMYHAVRREAERLVVPNLDALLAGRESPRNEDERLALLAVRESTRQSTGAAERPDTRGQR
jgi:tetratricopeptide (TPR) repeat protein